jgi:predicted transposase YbfD/YdcC
MYIRRDALPKKTFQIAREAKVWLIVQVKKNQENLLKRCKTIVSEGEMVGSHREETLGRNRLEIRGNSVYFYPSDKLRWKYVKMVVKVEREVTRWNGKRGSEVKSIDISYYVSNYVWSAEELWKAIRNHWCIENKNHYVKDVSLEEDRSRIRKNPEIMAILRSMSLNILRANGIRNIKTALYENSLSLETLRYLKWIF